MECPDNLYDKITIVYPEDCVQTVTVSATEYIEYPIDKVNRVLWDESKKIDFNQIIRLTTSQNKRAMVEVKIDFSTFSETDGITLSKSLTIFDKVCLLYCLVQI